MKKKKKQFIVLTFALTLIFSTNTGIAMELYKVSEKGKQTVEIDAKITIKHSQKLIINNKQYQIAPFTIMHF